MSPEPSLRGCVEVVSCGAIAAPHVGEGRMLPHLIIDTSGRPDIDKIIEMHCDHGPGDVKSTWGSVLGQSNKFVLHLEFMKPAMGSVPILFDIDRHAGAIDQIIRNNGVYIMPGRFGDVLSKSLDRSSVIIEVPEAGFSKKWDRSLFFYMRRVFKKQGLNTNKAERAARDHILSWRTLGNYRMPL